MWSVRTICAKYSIYKEYVSSRQARLDTKVWLKVLFSGVRCGGEEFPMSAGNWGRVNRAAGYYSIQMGFACWSRLRGSAVGDSSEHAPTAMSILE
jgi:hypothetical protein